MEKVLIWTKAYNAERTIRRTIESVLGQTYENWQYYVLDNGSTDATGTIIRKYVQKDSRIHIQRNDQNIFDAMFDPDDLDCDAFDYIAFLDADDEYKPEFLEKATKFAQTSALDMVMCGSDFINTANGKAAGTRQIGENNLVIEDRDFGQSFSVCFQFYRTYWGKLIRMPLVKQLNVHELPKVTYGLDTIFILALVQKSARVGILGGTLHKYYVSAKSVSYQWHDRRIISDIMLFDVARDFLISKCGSLSPRNEEFLLLVYMNALLDTLRVLLNSNVSDAEKLDALREMFLCEHTKVLAAWEQFGGHFNNAGEHTKRRGELFLAAAQWLLSRKEIADEQIVSYCELGEFLCAACENADGWLFFKKLFAQFLLDNGRTDEAREKIDELAELLPEDEDVKGYVSLVGNPTGGGGYAHTGNIDDEGLSSKREEAILPTKKYPNGCDEDFYNIMEQLRGAAVEQLLTEAQKSVSKWRETDKAYYELLLKWYKDWYRVGAFRLNDQGFMQYFGGMYTYLKQHTDDLIWLYEQLGNYRSKYQLKTVLQHWLTFTPDIREYGIEKTYKHYYDLDLIQCDENEVFVDCGAYDGDSITSFIEEYNGRYKSIYGYELTPSTFKKATHNLEPFERVYMRNAGVADKNGTMTFIDTIDAGNRLNAGGTAVGKIVALDNDITEDITFIKMDIEGAELAALIGAQNHIRRSKPKLAISLYHKLNDLIEIPKLVKQLVPEYQFYFQHAPAKFPFPTEYVLLAVMA